MTDFLIYDTEAEALSAEATISARGKQLAAAAGYTVDAEGIVGKSPDGEDHPDAVRTERWDIPRQRLDGKWVLAHPKYYPAAGLEVSPGVTYLDFTIAGIGGSVETEQVDWWPEVQDL